MEPLDTTFQDFMDEEQEALRLSFSSLTSTTLDKKYLLSPEKLDEKGMFPMPTSQREWWYELPAKPDEVEIRYLYDYDMSENEYVIPREVGCI